MRKARRRGHGQSAPFGVGVILPACGSVCVCGCVGCGEAWVRGCVGASVSVADVQSADPWRCYRCDATPITQLVERCEALQRKRQRQQQRRALARLQRANRAEHQRPEAQRGRGRAFASRTHDGASTPTRRPEGAKETSPPSRQAREVADAAARAAAKQEAEADEAADPLTLWPAQRAVRDEPEAPAVTVLPRLARQLKPHQEVRRKLEKGPQWGMRCGEVEWRRFKETMGGRSGVEAGGVRNGSGKQCKTAVRSRSRTCPHQRGARR
eukprot:6185927-Pleurochrysis_carterae.AAC.1